MQSKGAIKFVTIVLALACIYQLSFTAVSSIIEKKAKNYAEQKAEAYDISNVELKDQAFILDSVKKYESRWYTDSIATEKVFFGLTYNEVKAKEISLGLDLKGGMNVMLQVQLEDLVKALAGENDSDPTFQAALSAAKAKVNTEHGDFITHFETSWKEISNGKRLSSVFGTYEMRDRIKPESTDEQVISIIREDADAAIANSFNVLRNRIDRFGVASPSIQRIGNTGRILVELPGVKEPERVRKLLQGTASLEFWTTYENTEIFPFLSEANQTLAANSTDGIALFSVLQPSGAQRGACIGYANAADTAKVNSLLKLTKEHFPAEFRPMWSVKPASGIGAENIFELVAIKASSRDGKAPLDGDAVSDAHVSYDQQTGGNPTVSMSMNAEGANTWARLTKDNIGKQIAIVLDGAVYSYPVVNQEITGGNSQISGNFTIEEATDLTNVLKSGKLPAPATIVQEQVVGPSLGAESIKSGLISFVIAFVLVLIYMLFFYRGAGLAANAALILNVLFLFGTLAAFGATLTLPGIAGLILTLGMAVDANVIIYERIKEELKAGKGLSKAITDGYKNAYSAIIDGQVTTLLTGIVLAAFGSGPIKGFATTLIIGIITSIITSIFVTRLILDKRASKGKNITFETKATANFLKNTKIDFLGARKYSYVISAVLILVAVGSFIFKGFTFGVDFTGGRTYVVRFDNSVTAEDVREATLNVFNEAAAADETIKNASVEVKQYGGDSQMKITTSYKHDNESTEVDKEIESMLYSALSGFFAEDITLEQFTSTLDNPNGIISSDKVGASIANDIKRNAIISVIIALFVIFAYIAWRFKGWTWGLAGVVSLAHTAVIIIGFFSLFTGILPFNLDVDQTFIAAILTIIGYAINDNVVIFDRIRENLQLHPNADFKATVNQAVNATLTRTVNTSVSTLLPMLAIAIFGGESIRGLSVALCLGICIGTYASIMIGTPIMVDLSLKEAKKKGTKK